MKKIIFIILIFAFVPSAALALDGYEDFYVPSGIGSMGLAGVSSAVKNEAVHVNPAALTADPSYTLDFTSSLSLDVKHYPVGINLYDGVTNHFLCTHIGFVFANEENGRHYSFRLGLGVPIVDKILSVGVGGKWIWASLKDKDATHKLGLDVGLLIEPGAGIRLGFAVKNVAERYLDEHGKSFTSGVSWNSKWVVIAADYTLYYALPLTGEEKKGSSVQTGLQINIAWFILRGGYRYGDYDDSHAVTAGLGLKFKVWEFGAGYFHTISTKAKALDIDSMRNLMFNMRLNFDEALGGEDDSDLGGPSFSGEGESSW